MHVQHIVILLSLIIILHLFVSPMIIDKNFFRVSSIHLVGS